MRKFGFWGPLGCLILAGILHLFFPDWAEPPESKYGDPTPYWCFCLCGAGVCAGIAWLVFWINKRWLDVLFLLVSHAAFGCLIGAYVAVARWGRIVLVGVAAAGAASWGTVTGMRRLLAPLRAKRAQQHLDAAIGFLGVAFHERALSQVDNAVKQDPENSLACLTRGLILADMERSDEAIADLTRAVELDPDLAFALEMRGILYGRQGRYADAVVDFTAAIDCVPKDGSLYEYRAEAFAWSGFYAQAWDDVAQAHALGHPLGERLISKLLREAPELEPPH